jgi:hypothetical protein
MTLLDHYLAVDMARLQLKRAEADLKIAARRYALDQGFLIAPRLETLRAQLHI